MAMDSVCVFCGSRPGNDPAYVAAARETGTAIAKRGWRLVYGGGQIGIMGAVADAALAAGGEVIGVIPRSLLHKEVAHPGVTRMHVVTSMHRRKALMSSLSDGFLTLPGGFGTLEEFFETLTWAQLGLQPKPCALLNVEGFWDPMLKMMENLVGEGFVSPEHLELVLSGREPSPLLDRMAVYEPPPEVRTPQVDPEIAAGPAQDGRLDTIPTRAKPLAT
jgi:uncharacterized protein (TIGR00730 family)